MKINFNLKMEEIIRSFNGEKKSLLLHSCCAPCNSHVLNYLMPYFDITVYFYNPNINVSGEFEFRYQEQIRYINEIDAKIEVIKGEVCPSDYLEAVKGFENLGEGSERCERCFELRLRKSASKAKEMGLDYFATSLTISPMKSSEKLNEIGQKISEEIEVSWLYSDFKKKGGYQNSVKLSNEYNLYRQNYCGCSFSKAESLAKEKEQNNKTEN